MRARYANAGGNVGRIGRWVLVVVLVGSVTSVAGDAQAAPTPVSACNTTVTSNAKLIKDLVCPGTHGIIVGAHGITIDLGGHSLTGDRTSFKDGISNSTFDDVTVRSGTVEKFNIGVRGADGMYVERVVTAGNFAGIGIGGDSARVSSSEASGNGGDGIFINGDSARVSSSEASGNGFSGIFIIGDSARVSSSQASGNADNGIEIDGNSARVSSSQASGNDVNGIYINGNTARVSSSKASGNGRAGIFVDGDRAVIRSSHASANPFDGIEIAGDAAKIGQLPGKPNTHRNRTDANGYGVTDDIGLGIYAHGFVTAPVGRNVATGNDNPDECQPTNIC